MSMEQPNRGTEGRPPPAAPSEAELLQLARQWGDTQDSSSPPDVRAALANARARAVAARVEAPAWRVSLTEFGERVRLRWGRRWQAGFAGGAVGLACALLLWTLQSQPAREFEALEELSAVGITEDMQLLDELEFLAWVALEEERVATAGEAG